MQKIHDGGFFIVKSNQHKKKKQLNVVGRKNWIVVE